MPRRIISFFGLVWFLVCVLCAADWSKPTLTSQDTDVLTELKARDVSTGTMAYSGDTNLPDGLIRFNRSNSRFEEYDSGTTTWADATPAITAHLVSTANPHATTAAQVGAATTGALSAHTSNTSNPHSVTAAQLGALTAAGKLSEITDAPVARFNIGAAAAADLTAHLGNTSNPHSVTAAQLGAAVKSANLSDLTNAATARSNISAAQSGTNTDINHMSFISDINNSLDSGNPMQINAAGIGSYITFKVTSLERFRITHDGKFYSAVSRPDYTPWVSFTTLRSINPATATAADCANVLNTMMQDQINIGPWQ